MRGELRHAVQHGMHVRHHVAAVMRDGGVARGPQRHVQHRASFRNIDGFAAEHGVDPRAQAGFIGKLQQQAHGFVGDAVLGIVQVETRGLHAQALPAPRIFGKQVPQMDGTDLLVMALQRLPGGTLAQGGHGHGFAAPQNSTLAAVNLAASRMSA